MKKQIVYRFLSQNEFESWKNGEKNSISKQFKNDNLPAANNHKYQTNVKYIHFFKNLEDAPIIFNTMDANATYLCKFEISRNILNKFVGKGIYYDIYDHATEICEYAIPLNFVDCNCIKEFKIIKNINDAKFLNPNLNWKAINKEIEDKKEM